MVQQNFDIISEGRAAGVGIGPSGITPKQEINIFYQNVRGLRTKTSTFYNSIAAAQHSIVAVTESWATPDIGDSELFPTNYTVNRTDRCVDGLSRGGGVMLATKGDIKAAALDLQQINKCVPLINIVGSRLTFSDCVVYVFVLYVSPSVSFEHFALFFEMFSSLDYVFEDKIIILGDFNVPAFASPTAGDRFSGLLRDSLNLLNADQYNEVLNCHGRRLDLVFSTQECNVTRCYDPLVEEDAHHPSLLVSFPITRPLSPLRDCMVDRVFNFRKADFPLLYESLRLIDWSGLYGIKDVDLACSEFYRTLNSVFQNAVPYFKPGRRKKTYPHWFSLEVIHLLRRKRRAHRMFRKFGDPCQLESFKSIRATVKFMLRRDYNNFLSETANRLTTDPREFWAFVRSKRGGSGIPGLVRDVEGVEYDSPESIAEAFANYFSSVYTLPNASQNIDPLFYSRCDTRDCIAAVSVTGVNVIEASKNLKNNMTSGEDMIPGFLVRDCSTIFADPLQYLFNLILSTSTYPKIWKQTRVHPVLKKGDPTLLNNYRPISLVSNFAKIFDAVLYEQIYPLVKKHISPFQHGFMEKKSTVTNLACFSQSVSEILDSRGQVDVVYTDISKAFDRIDLNLLMVKLDKIGFSPPLLRLFNSYLFDREQRVTCHFTKSNPYIATSGVAQGAKWGPLLFLIYINDLAEMIICNKLLFADDLKLYSTIDTALDCVALQRCVDAVCEWCSKNGLSLNVDKCVVVTFTRKLKPITYNYKIGPVVVGRSEVVRDLGVVFDSAFSFKNHIDDVISSSLRTLGFIYRSCRELRSASCLKALYCSLVRSKLEYASLIWYPIYSTHIARLESVQRRFLKFMTFILDGVYPLQGFNHELLLARCEFVSLETRHTILCVKFLFNLLNNLIDCPELLERVTFLVPRLNSRHKLTFYCDAPNSNALVRSPILTMCNIYNKYSTDCDIFYDSFNILKTCILNSHF